MRNTSPTGTDCSRKWRTALKPETAAIALAVDRGWMLLDGSHSGCLTNVGRKLVEVGRRQSPSLAVAKLTKDLHAFV
jgi:hypothetical protein